ncbi:CopG family ribbon-helix-helix protein [Sediminivirga luteola]|nr:CopG family transcriptional regulator [Sediminivirga luteola]
MAMNVRLPEELDAQLDRLAREQGVSKHALLIEGVQDVLKKHNRKRMVQEALADVDDRYGDVVARLAET